MQQMLEVVGFRVTIETAERVTYNQRLADRDYHISTIGTGTSPDPEQQSGNFTTGGPGNWGAYSNPEVDDLVAQARQISDIDERAELYKEVQRLIHEDGEITILSRHPAGNMSRSRLKGIRRDQVVTNLRYAWLEDED
jgi:peptide/nickel transport system substrate-binding protein